jgi:hypothetical protein
MRRRAGGRPGACGKKGDRMAATKRTAAEPRAAVRFNPRDLGIELNPEDEEHAFRLARAVVTPIVRWGYFAVAVGAAAMLAIQRERRRNPAPRRR